MTSGQVTGAGLEALAGAPITRLELQGCPKLDDSALSQLPKLPLTELTLHGSDWLTNAGLEALRGNNALTSLDLGGCPLLNHESLRSLQGLPLEHLVLGCAEYQVPEEGMAALRATDVDGVSAFGVDLGRILWYLDVFEYIAQ